MDGVRETLLGREREVAARLVEHEHTLARLRAQLGSEVTDDEHDPEGTTLSADWSLLEGVRAAEERELADIRMALDRLDSDRYGICEGCGEPIAPERLEVRPMATRCVNCAR